MPTIVPPPDDPVNVPPIQGPPVPADALPVQGPPVPAGFIPPPAPISGQVTQNPAPAAAPVVPEPTPAPAAPVDPMAVSGQALGNIVSATKEQRAAAEDEARAQQEKTEADAKAADAAAAEIRTRQANADRQLQASEQARARLVQLAESADNDVANFKFEDYGDTIPATKKMRLAIGAALSGMHGGDPMAHINKAISRHFDQEKAQLSTKEAVAKSRRQGIDDHDKHVNDQRLYLEFAERNYREAMNKDIEARALRSGSPVVLARARELIAKNDAIGNERVMGAANAYIQGEERREHANLLRSKARGAGGGGGGGNDAFAQLAEAKANGASHQDLVKLALKLKVKDPLKTVKEVQEGAGRDQKQNNVDASLAVYDPRTSELLGGVGTPAAANKINEDLKTLDLVRGDTEALKRHVTDAKTGGAVAPFGMTEASRTRATLGNSLVTRMSGFRGLGAISKDDRAILEGIINGGVSGILGLNAKQLDEVIAALDRAEKTTLQSQGIRKTAPAAAPAADMVTIRNGKTGETKQVTREEAKKMGAL